MNTVTRAVPVSIVLYLTLLYSVHAQTTFDLYGAQSAYADIADIRMYYETYGKGEPLLLLHGATGYIGNFAYQLPELSNYFRIIAPESRGQGRTTDSDKPISYHLMSEDIIKLMDHLKIESAYVVGWSDGGNIGLSMAFDHGIRVKKLVVIGASFHFSGLRDDFIEIAQSYTPETFPHKAYSRLAPDPGHWPVFFEKIMENMMTQPTFTTEELKKIQCPILVVAGDHDVIKMDHTVKLFEALPRGQLMVVPNTSHMVLREKPEIINQAIIRFLLIEDAKTEFPFRKKQ